MFTVDGRLGPHRRRRQDAHRLGAVRAAEGDQVTVDADACRGAATDGQTGDEM